MKISHWITLEIDRIKENVKFQIDNMDYWSMIENMRIEWYTKLMRNGKKYITPNDCYGKLPQRPQIHLPRTYGNSPLCPTGHWPFGAAALLSLHILSWSLQAGHRVPLSRWPCAILGWLVPIISTLFPRFRWQSWRLWDRCWSVWRRLLCVFHFRSTFCVNLPFKSREEWPTWKRRDSFTEISLPGKLWMINEWMNEWMI